MPEEEKSPLQEKVFAAKYNAFAEKYKIDPMLFAFGPTVKILREKLTQRMMYHQNTRVPSGLALPVLSSRKLIGALGDLQENSYPISSGAFSSIESGNSLPRDPQKFINALEITLHIEKDSDEYNELQHAEIFTSALRDLGEEAAWAYLWTVVGLTQDEYTNKDKAKEKFFAYVDKRKALLKDGYLPKTSLHPSRRYSSLNDILT